MRVLLIPKARGNGTGANMGGDSPSPHLTGNQMPHMPQQVAPHPHMPQPPFGTHPMPQQMAQNMPRHEASMYGPHAGPVYGERPAMEYGMAEVWPSQQGSTGGQMPHGPQARAMGFTAPPRQTEDMGGMDSMGNDMAGYEPEARRRSRSTGRFVRSEGASGAEMRGGSRHSEPDDDDEGYAESRPAPSSGSLKKRIKKMEKQMEKICEMLEEALEEKDSKPKSKGKGKKKPDPEDDDDDEDDPAESETEPEAEPEPSPAAAPLAAVQEKLDAALAGKPALEHIPAIMASLLAVLESPPATWPPYLQKDDYSGIFAMECKELLAKVQQYKAGQVNGEAVKKELAHSGAALLQLFAQIMHKS